MCVFGKNNFCQLILLYILFLVLFMGLTALFDTIHGPHCTISANFYIYLQYFRQKVFNFNKISRSQTDPTSNKLNAPPCSFSFYFMRKHIPKIGCVFSPSISDCIL